MSTSTLQDQIDALDIVVSALLSALYKHDRTLMKAIEKEIAYMERQRAQLLSPNARSIVTGMRSFAAVDSTPEREG